jgi:hypothetical protein
MIKGKSHEGFEVTVNEIQMSLRMHFSIFLMLLVMATACVVYHNYTSYMEMWKYVLVALWKGLKTNNNELFNAALGYVFPIIWQSKKVIIAAVLLILPCQILVTRLFKWKAIRERMNEYVRAARMVPKSWISRKLWFKDRFIPVGDLMILVHDETAHVFIVGKTRTGKSQLIKKILKKLKKRGHKVIVYENKGDHLPYYYKPLQDIIYCPVDKRTIKWTIWNDVKTRDLFLGLVCIFFTDCTKARLQMLRFGNFLQAEQNILQSV